MSNVVCPYCFEKFDRSTVSFRCTNQRCTGKSLDSLLQQHWNGKYAEVNKPLGPVIPSKSGFLSRFLGMPDHGTCGICGEKAFTTICPKCHNRLPREMVSRQGHIISIIGAKGSGKTNYITVLINELMRHGHCLGNMGITAVNIAEDPQFNTQTRYNKDFFDILYKKRTAHKSTDILDVRSKIPLIYELSFPKSEPVYLVLYDTAGENFDDPKRIDESVKYLRESDAIIFLLDSFCIPYVHDTLGLNDNIDRTYNFITDNLISYFKNCDPKLRDAHFNKPIALTFSKIDAILTAEDKFEETSIANMSIDSNSSFLEDSVVNLSEFVGISASIQSALRAWSEVNFVTSISNNYKNARYFGISALGDKPDGSGTLKSIKPYRVLDPLVWILNQIGCKLPIKK